MIAQAPLLLPPIYVVATTIIITALKSFDIVYTLTNGAFGTDVIARDRIRSDALLDGFDHERIERADAVLGVAENHVPTPTRLELFRREIAKRSARKGLLRREILPGDTDDADQPLAAGVVHDLRGKVLLLLGLAAASRAGDDLEGQVREEAVDQRPDQR